jgi:hypothetical protein
MKILYVEDNEDNVVVELNSKNQAFWCPSPSPPDKT